jgi:hypothetical protein
MENVGVGENKTKMMVLLYQKLTVLLRGQCGHGTFDRITNSW